MNTHCYFDVEAVAVEGAEKWLDDSDIQPNGTLKDPVKIAADIAAKKAKRLESLALDPFTLRLRAIATCGLISDPYVTIINDEYEERDELVNFWNLLGRDLTLVGYCCNDYDLPVVVTRSRLLGVKVPQRFAKKFPDVIDLKDHVDVWSKGGTRNMSRSLVNICRRFGIAIPDDELMGKDMATATDEQVKEHVTRDVLRTRELAKRLGVC